MNRTSINHSALVLSVAMATAWPLSPALADKGGTPHERGVHPKFGLATPLDGPFPADRFTIEDETGPAPDAEARVGIDQGVWDPDMHTLYVEAAKVLDQHTRYALFVTRAVKDVDGEPIATSKAFRQAIGDDADDDGAKPDDREL